MHKDGKKKLKKNVKTKFTDFLITEIYWRIYHA